MQTFTPTNWQQYELLDCGDYEKLEKFGSITLRRPEPQALWSKKLSEQEWKNLADITFKPKTSHSGEWIKKNKDLPDRWKLNYNNKDLNLNFLLLVHTI